MCEKVYKFNKAIKPANDVPMQQIHYKLVDDASLKIEAHADVDFYWNDVLSSQCEYVVFLCD